MPIDREKEHSITTAIFSVSAGMVGICLTAIGLLQVVGSVRKISTAADEILAVDAVMFLGCCFLVFLSFRTQHPLLQLQLRKWADGLFFIGLLLMVIICALITSSFL